MTSKNSTASQCQCCPSLAAVLDLSARCMPVGEPAAAVACHTQSQYSCCQFIYIKHTLSGGTNGTASSLYLSPARKLLALAGALQATGQAGKKARYVFFACLPRAPIVARTTRHQCARNTWIRVSEHICSGMLNGVVLAMMRVCIGLHA